MNIQEAIQTHTHVKEKALFGRYMLPSKIVDLIAGLSSIFEVQTVGFSVEKRPIHTVTFGRGKKKILMWSQMHGNESTTTKSIFDFFNFIQSDLYAARVSPLLENFTFCIIPMLNPDGSQIWTRENANNKDLNRDAQAQSQPESQLLKLVFDTFQPDFCFNLHGQRTIYGFEDTGNSSVLSFLAPAASISRDFPVSRKRAASIISHIQTNMKGLLPGQIGRYDDAFNADCVGDAFQHAGVTTVLFEAGHYAQDYSREQTRVYVFVALILAIEAIKDDVTYNIEVYKSIPEHSKCFCDLFKEVAGGNLAFQYKEILEGELIRFEPTAVDLRSETIVYAHKVSKECSTFKV